MSVHLEVAYPSVVASEAKLLQRLNQVLEENDVNSEERRAFTLAVSEAFTNALIHGNEFDAKKTIKICLDINESVLRADIIDQGLNGLMKVKRPRQNDPLAEGGRGIRLIEHYVADVHFEQTAGSGLKVSIILKRKQPTTTDSE